MRRALVVLVSFLLVSPLGLAAQQPDATGKQLPLARRNAPPSTAAAPSTANDDSRVLAMLNKGFDDDIIIARIKSSDWTFQLSDDEMLALRKAGVSSRVVAVMIDNSQLAGARVEIDDRPVQLNTLGQAKIAGKFMNNLTGDFTSLKEKAFLEGPTASNSASPMPEITVTVPKGDSIGNYVLVQLDPKSDRRELEMGTGGGVEQGKSGIRPASVRPTRVIDRGNNIFQLLPLKPLKPGQYMLYVLGSADQRRDVYGTGYDFSVLQ